MSQVAAATPINSSVPQSIKPMQVMVVGKVIEVRRWESNEGYTVRVVIPAADEYSSPDTVDVQCSRTSARKDDDYRQLCRISGWMKKGANGSFNNLRLRAVEL